MTCVTNAADSEWKLLIGSSNLLKLYHRALSDPGKADWSRLAIAQSA